MLGNSRAANTVCPEEDSSPTPTDPEPRQQSSYRTDKMPEPATMHEPAPGKGNELNITAEHEPPQTSDHACELATPCDVLGALVKFKGMEEDPAHTPTGEGDMLLTTAINFCDELEVDFTLISQPR